MGSRADEHDWRRTASVVTVGFVTFVGDCARGLLFPVLWPLCQKLGGSKLALGYLVSTFSIGRLVITTPIGMIADRYGHRLALLLSALVLTLGSVAWAHAPQLGGLYALFGAQFLLGLGTGTLGVTRSYISERTPPFERTRILAYLSALQYAGFAATPLLGVVFISSQDTLSYRDCAWPAYLLLALSLATLACLFYPFRDYDPIDYTKNLRLDATIAFDQSRNKQSKQHVYSPLAMQEEDKKDKEVEAVGDIELTVLTPSLSLTKSTSPPETMHPSLSPIPTLIVTPEPAPVSTTNTTQMLVACILVSLNFTTRGVLSVLETQMPQIWQSSLHASQRTLGAWVSLAGGIGVVHFLCIGVGAYKLTGWSDFVQMLVGLVLMGVACGLGFVWVGPDEAAPGGSPLPSWQYIVSLILLYAIAYPLANSAVLGLFSTLQRAGRQGGMQGGFALGGSLARVLCPLLSAYIDTYVERGGGFAFALLLVCFSIIGGVLWDLDDLEHSSGQVQRHSDHGKHKRAWLAGCLLVMGGVAGAMVDWGVEGW